MNLICAGTWRPAMFMVVAWVGGCESASMQTGILENPPDSSATVQLRETPAACQTCLVLEPMVTLGDDSSANLVYTTKIVRDSLGRFWLGQRDGVKVFEASGKYVGEPGRPGRGPLEFSAPDPARAGSNGTVEILDLGNARLTTVTADFELASESGLPSANIRDFAPLPGTAGYVLNMWLMTPDGIGHPLHVVRGRAVLHSFGASDSMGPQDPMKARRVLAVDGSGRIFSLRVFDYEMDVWTPTGRRIVGYSGPKLNQKEVRNAAFNLEDNPIPNQVLDAEPDAGSRLWVLFSRVREDWKRHVVSHVSRRGEVGLRRLPGVTDDSLYSTRIEVIDLSTGRIVARRDGSELLTGFIGPGLVFANTSGPDDVPHVVVWRVHLNTEQR